MKNASFEINSESTIIDTIITDIKEISYTISKLKEGDSYTYQVIA